MVILYIINLLSIILFLFLFWYFFHKVVGKRTLIILSIVGVFFIELLYLVVPLPNSFAYFDSPEKVFHIKHDEVPVLDVSGNDSMLIVAVEDQSFAYITDIALKDERGWKVAGLFATAKVASALYPNVTVEIIHIRGTADYYVTVYSLGESLNLSDSLCSVFEETAAGMSSRGPIYAYYACINAFDETYSLIADGELLLQVSN